MSNKELKKKLLAQILEELERERQTLIQAAQVAHEAATHEESKAEDKYDTRGLEASYLAGAQAKRAMDLEKIIFDLSHLEISSSNTNIRVTALVKLRLNDEKVSKVFLVPHGAGITLEAGKEKIQIVTPSSPLGQELIGRSEGDEFEIVLAKQKQSFEILECL